MKIVGCDFHPSYQQVAILGTETGEVQEKKLIRASGEAEKFYRELETPALVGMEATGNSRWFELMVEKLGHQLWIGDAAKIRASYVRKQKTDQSPRPTHSPTSRIRRFFSSGAARVIPWRRKLKPFT